MKRTWRMMLALVIVAAAISCAPPAAEETEAEAVASVETETAPEPADPTVVDADHYTVEFENDRVRVLRTIYGPGEESVMHFHPDHVAVVLTDGHWEFELPDGSIEPVHETAGSHIFVPAGEHRPRNIGEESSEAIVVELKDGSGSESAEADGPDAIEVDADHYQAEFENDRVRIVRINYGPGEESVMHYHPDHFAVFLTEHHVQFQLPDGTSEEVHAGAGEHIFAAGGQHLPKNIGEEAFEVVIVELK